LFLWYVILFVIKRVMEGFSGEEAKDFVREISLHHRIPGGSGFHEAVEYVRWVLEDLGLDVEIDTRPLDGKFKIWTWDFPLAWDITSAELSVVEPEEKLVTSFTDTPVCVYNKSAPTPEDGVEAELVFVGEGTDESDYEDVDVEGKIVLARGSGEDVADLAVRDKGALGVITDFLRPHPPVKTRTGTPDLVQNALIRAKDRKLWGFSVSYNQFKHLKELLDRGPVRVNARINAKFVDDGILETVLARIPGSELENEEVLVISHLCHYRPGANDNASGVGLAMELIKTYVKAIEDEKISRPKRTITFIIGAEMYGALSYLERNWDRRDELVGGFCLDMLGEDQAETKAGIEISSVPDSLPSFLNDHVKTLLEGIARETLYTSSNAHRNYKYDARTVNFRYNISQFTPGSDHLIFDDSSVGVPVIQFGHWPDIYYHSSGDTIDKVSPEELKRNGTALGVAIYNLANTGLREALTFMNHQYTQTQKRIADNTGRSKDELLGLDDLEEIKNLLSLEFRRIDFLLKRDLKGLESILKLIKDEDNSNKLREISHTLEENLRKLTESEKKSLLYYTEKLFSIDIKIEELIKKKTKYDKIIPIRNHVGALQWKSFTSKISEEREKEYTEWAVNNEHAKDTFSNLNAKLVEGWSLSDGSRSIANIADALTFEYGGTDAKFLYEIFKDLEDFNYVSLKKIDQ